MKRFILLMVLSTVLCVPAAFCQTAVNVADNTLKVAGLSEEVFYYGFAEGDQLIFNFQEVNGKELKEVEIMELPSSSKFMDYKTVKIENKIINITKTGIYKFRFTNSAMSGRVCKFVIQRIPQSEATKNFNTSVYKRTIYDTTYTPIEEPYLIKVDTSFSDFYSSTPQISSSNALNGNNNYQIIDFALPDNTVSWSFYIGTGKEGKEEFEKSKESFLKSAAATVSNIPGYSAMAALALTGISYFSKVQGEDNVKYWFLADANSVALFQSNQTFMQYKQGDVIIEASQMKYPLNGKVYIALLNDNLVEPITVTVKATALIVKEQWGTRTVQKMTVTSHQEQYLKN